MATRNPKTAKNKKGKNHSPEGKFRFEFDLCCKNKDLAGAISLFDSAVSTHIRLNQHHFNALLYLCSVSVSDSDDPSSPQTLDNSAKELALQHGFRIFDHMLSSNIGPNEATITAAARLAAAKGDAQLAFELVRTMMAKYNASPRLRTCVPALLCFCAGLEADRAYEVEDYMNAVGLSAEESELAALLGVSVKTGRKEKVYEYLHKLRSSVRSVMDSTAEIIESWFSSRAASEVKGVDVEAGQIGEAVLRNGGGWHGLGWMGEGDWMIQRSNVDSDGHCCGCTKQLVRVDIDTEETEKFAQSVASLAMEREVKTCFAEFQVWLDEHADFEAIVDAANIGLYQQNFAEGGFSVSQLDAVVNELYNRSQGKWPLIVLHNKRLRALMDRPSERKLLEDWVARGILYATPNGSNDDWYWLYAAVKLKCFLVTNDEMRDHIFELLGRSFFLRWKENHQVKYTFVKGCLKLQMPSSYSLVIQESEEGSWHVPLASKSCEQSPGTWLCITRANSRRPSYVLANAETSEIGQPLNCSHKVLKSCTSKCVNRAPDSFLILEGEQRVAVSAGKRKDRSPSPLGQNL